MCTRFLLFGMARLPACSQERPPLHPGSIHVLNLKYSLKHISHMYMCVGHTYKYFRFYKLETISLHSILLFHHPWQVQLVLSMDPRPLHLLYLFPSLLAPMGIWIDHPSLWWSVYPLLWASDTGVTGYDKGSWDPCDHPSLGQKVSKHFWKFVKTMTKIIFFISSS